MSLIKIENYEQLVDGIVVFYKKVSFLGIPLYSSKLETTNNNYLSVFSGININKEEPEEKTTDDETSNIYKETNIGFNYGEEQQETTI